jgi:hypothetical protein
MYFQLPTRFGLKFKNKSEEERYLKLCARIIRLGTMEAVQRQQVYLQIQRFLSEYLFTIYRHAQS